jgi:hypothetical protein
MNASRYKRGASNVTNILEARGVFWWHSTPVPAKHFAPEDSVHGTLVIGADGQISLDLDGTMPGGKRLGRMFPGGESLPVEMSIQGILKGQKKHVLLQGVGSDGGSFSTGGITYERYLASTCIVGPTEIPYSEQMLSFTRLTISLRGFEAWTSLRSIDAIRQEKDLTIRYVKPESLSFDVAGGKLSITHSVKAPWISDTTSTKSNRIALEEQSELVYEPSVSCSLDEMMKRFNLIGDLLNLLADTTFQLDWPFLKADLIENELPYRLYFQRRTTDAEPPRSTDCWALLPAIKNDFGAIFSNWMKKRELYGPGYYLFLGTRRGFDLYVEHHYVNLIWGIEALHRRQPTEVGSPTGTEQRVQRILSEVTGKADRKWLKGKLKHAGEPTLEQRIFETFSRLPLSLSPKELRSFATSCANRRNDISHFGGQRPGGDYSEFVRELDLKNQALAYLVHAYILLDIGVSPETLNFWFFEGPKSYQIKRLLKAAGLESLAQPPSTNEVSSPKNDNALDQGKPQPEGVVIPNSANPSDPKCDIDPTTSLEQAVE